MVIQLKKCKIIIVQRKKTRKMLDKEGFLMEDGGWRMESGGWRIFLETMHYILGAPNRYLLYPIFTPKLGASRPQRSGLRPHWSGSRPQGSGWRPH